MAQTPVTKTLTDLPVYADTGYAGHLLYTDSNIEYRFPLSNIALLSNLGSSEEGKGADLVTVPEGRAPAVITRTVAQLLLDGEAGLRKNFGAVGDGVHDDTAAFEKWWDCLIDVTYKRNGALGNEPNFMLQKGPKLNIENGLFIYTGSGLNISSSDSFVFNVTGESDLSTKILVPDGVYLFDLDNNPVYTYLGNMTIHGGLGGVRFKSTASNPTSIHTLERLRFSGYSECAVSNNSIDWPYFRLISSMFYGDPTKDTIGACISGLTAGGSVTGCVFSDNKYGLKLSTATRNTITNGPTTPFTVQGCDFYRTSDRGTSESHDVWIVPGTSTNNAGRGLVFNINKFGSEFLQANDKHILIADQNATGTGLSLNGDRHHSTAISAGYVSGMSFNINNVNSVYGTARLPFIYSYTPNVGNTRLNDLYDNGMPSYMLEFASGITQAQVGNLTRSNVFSANQCMALQEGSTPGMLSNLNDVFKIEDPLFYYSGHPQAGYYPVSNQLIDYVSLYAGPTSGISIADATRSSVNNSYGGVSEATQITMSSSTGRAYATITGAVLNRKHWLDVEIKRATTNPVTSVRIDIFNSDASVLWLRRIVLVDTASRWQKITLPFIPSEAGTFIVRYTSNDYVDGTNTSFIVGNMRVYLNDNPIPTGHNSGLASGWSVQHTVVGNYHEWYDTSGNKRAKNGIPTSSTDGVIISANPITS